MLAARISFICLVLMTQSVSAQIYDDYFGRGHTIGVKVSSSSDDAPDMSSHTIDGANLIPDMVAASRFLSNATLGSDYEMIEAVHQMGVNAWIDQQIADKGVSYLNMYKDIHDGFVQLRKDSTSGIVIDSARRQEFIGYAFFQKLFTESDVLRQRTAFALSQIFVISRSLSQLNSRGYGLSSYYDVLYDNAFGNFRDLLRDVTLHPAMGVYLSHFKNKKSDPVAGVFPDENYAREIMQLFTIGLMQLNMDGSPKLDAQGKIIPTYDIEDVQEMAKVFTGLAGGALDPNSNAYKMGLPLKFNRGIGQIDMTVPMMMYEDEHDTSEKVLISGDTLPAGQAGMTDIDQVLDMLFHHDNTPPFFAKRMIQHMVKSNPSPEYINRVSLAFVDNGSGVRGDIGAVVRAILTDPEAIECDGPADTTGGKLIQPLERFLNLYIAFDISSPSGKYYFRDINTLHERVEQSFLNSPTVFNFFTPFYAETDHVDPADLVSPEFEILNSSSSINYMNLIEDAIKKQPFKNMTTIDNTNGKIIYNRADIPELDLGDEIALYESAGVTALLDRLSLVLCRGQLSQQTKDIVANTISQYESQLGSYNSSLAVKDAIYFIMVSPDYIVQK